MRAVAQRIKQERERQGKSTTEMAHILSVPEQEIIRIESGELQLTMRDIADFAIALDVEPNYLKFGVHDWQTSVSNMENPTFDSSNVATNTATHMTTNNYYSNHPEALQDQINRIENAAHKGRLGSRSQMDRIEEQLKLLHEKIDFLITVENSLHKNQ